MSGKINAYPSIPKDFLARSVWTEMNTGKDKYIGHLCYPVTAMDTNSGTVYRLDVAYDQLHSDRSSGTETAPEIGAEEKGVSYVTENIRFNYLINPRKINKAPNPMKKREQEYQNGTIITTRSCRLAFEKMAADKMFATSVWTTENSATVTFSDPDENILTDLYTLAGDFELLNGYLPRVMVIGGKVYNWMMKNKQIIAKLPTIEYSNLTMNNIVQALRGAGLENLEKIYVGRQSYTSSNVKTAAVTRSRLWGDYIWLGDIEEQITGDGTTGATMGISIEGNEDPLTRIWRTENMAAGYEYIESAIELGTVNVDPNKGALLKGLV